MGYFGNLSFNIGTGVASGLIDAGFYAAHYTRRDGDLKFLSERGYDNVYVYAARRRAFQLANKELENLYPYLKLKREHKKRMAAIKEQQKERIKVIENGHRADRDTFGSLFEENPVTLKYRGHEAPEGMLLWIEDSEMPKGQVKDFIYNTYWDKIKDLSDYDPTNPSKSTQQMTRVQARATDVFMDMTVMVRAQGGNNVILTKVQGRDYSRKEMISRADMTFSVQGNIVSNFPDIYPYKEVSDFLKIMRHKGVIKVYNIMFQQFSVTQILIKDFTMGQVKGCKNVQPYSFTCVAVEPDKEMEDIADTINAVNAKIAKKDKKSGWAKFGEEALETLKNSSISKASEMVQSLTAHYI